jgi:hypothetical protein
MGYPAPGRRTLGRVARAAQHGRVADVYRRTAGGERDDVIDGQVRRSVGGTEVARAPVTVLATPGAQHAGAEPLPGSRALQRVVPAPVGLPGVLGAATTSAAGDDTADRAQLHPRIVDGRGGAVYSPAVLGLRDQAALADQIASTTSNRLAWQDRGGVECHLNPPASGVNADSPRRLSAPTRTRTDRFRRPYALRGSGASRNGG